jgi:uncharacterized membrane protein
MKIIKTLSLYLLATFYFGMGAMHLLKPKQYLTMMPSLLPAHKFLIYSSGIIEIVLAVLLLLTKTRAIAAKLIIVMLTVYLFTIHIPQSINFYQTENKGFVASIIKLLIQLILIYWARVYADFSLKRVDKYNV